MFPKIVQVVPTEDHTVYVYFEDGKIVCYDVKPLLEKEAFAILREVNCFLKTCTIMNDTLAWDISGNWQKWRWENNKCFKLCKVFFRRT